MESQILACGCGARLKAPASLGPGQKMKCPKCGSLLAMPEASGTAVEEPVPVAMAVASPDSAEPAAMKDCPFCGERILAHAMKCRHCGEFLQSDKGPASSGRKLKAAPTSDGEPNPAEYLVAFLFAPIGLLIGLVWAARRLPKARKMLQTSGLSLVIVAVGGLLFYIYFVREESTGPGVSTSIVIPNFNPADFSPEPPDRPQARRSSPTEFEPPVLEGQPPEIQKAMKANVYIAGENSSGSGVVIQRNADAVLILTNRHVVDMDFARSGVGGNRTAESLPEHRIIYYNRQINPGQVVWIAPDDIDLALVRTGAPSDIEPVAWQAEPRAQAGQAVFAIGNPVGLGWSYTQGVVSAVRLLKEGARPVPIIQTDAALTHGNSGGGLYSTDGVLLGINTSITDPGHGPKIGFAIRTSLLAELKPDGLTLPGAPKPEPMPDDAPTPDDPPGP